MSIHLSEVATDLIVEKLKQDLPAALAAVRVNRNDALVTTEPPKSYFIYGGAYAYRAPAVFVVVDAINFQLDRGQNFTEAKIIVKVSGVVEDKDLQRLTIKSYRYQAAMHSVLAQARLTSTDDGLTIVLRVTRAEYSPAFTDSGKPEVTGGVFRKEVMFEIECEAFENL